MVLDWKWNITTPSVGYMIIDKSSLELLFMNFGKIEIVICLIGRL